jgi:hypothetical protein
VKGSVFEDNVVAFKEEDAPFEFSRATSLSSLTIDDEPKISNDAILKVGVCVCLELHALGRWMDSLICCPLNFILLQVIKKGKVVPVLN